MKNNALKIILLVLAAALLSLSLSAQPVYGSAPGAREYPDADVLILSEKISLTLMPDGRIEESRHKVEKVLTYNGIDTIGDPKIAFDTATQALAIDKCTTFSPDGRVTEAQKNSFTEMTPFELEKSPDHVSIRQMVVTKVGMELGSVVEFGYTVKDTKPWRKYLQGKILVQNEYPTLVKEITIRVPRGTSLLLSGGVAVERSDESDYTVYRAALRDLPALNFHEFVNHEEYLHPCLVYSTAPGWAAQAAHLGTMFSEAAGKRSGAMEKKAKELTEKKLSDREKALSIHDFVTTKMRAVDWGLDAFDYSARDASRVFETSGGHKMDLAVLLSAMLDSVGLKAEPWLVMNAPFGDEEAKIPAVSLFDDVVMTVGTGTGTLFLGSDAPASSASLRDWTGSRALKISSAVSGLSVFPALSEGNSAKCAFSLEPLDGAVVRGTGSVLLTGGYANYESARTGIEGEIIPYVKGALPDAADIKVTARNISADHLDAEVEFTVDLKKAAGKTGLHAVLNTGLPGASIVNCNHLAGREKRTSPMILSMTGNESYEISIKLPDCFAGAGNRLVSFSHDTPALKASQDFTEGEGKVTVSYSVSTDREIISAGDYGKARQAALSLLTEPARKLVLEEKKKK